jgi:sigma-E factor negative regulatory protein RseA
MPREETMNRESLRESLSAVMDNEADELELHRVLAASDESELRAIWSRYQIARAVIHKELQEPRLDIAAGVMAALAEEKMPEQSGSRSRWSGLGRLAIAASVTLAVLAGVRFYNQDQITGAEMAQQNAPSNNLIIPHVQGPAVLAGYSAEGESGAVMAEQGAQPSWHDQRLADYLRQHVQQSGRGEESALPSARAASLENR